MDRPGRESVKDFSRLSPEKRRELFVHLIRLTEADIEKALTAEQRLRLREIDLQRKRERAFEEPNVSAALKLTVEQKEQIRVIRDKAFKWYILFTLPGADANSLQDGQDITVRGRFTSRKEPDGHLPMSNCSLMKEK